MDLDHLFDRQVLHRISEHDGSELEVYDVDHSEPEDRFKSIGPIRDGLALVVWTERADDLVRIISARWATKAERELYAESVENPR